MTFQILFFNEFDNYERWFYISLFDYIHWNTNHLTRIFRFTRAFYHFCPSHRQGNNDNCCENLLQTQFRRQETVLKPIKYYKRMFIFRDCTLFTSFSTSDSVFWDVFVDIWLNFLPFANTIIWLIDGLVHRASISCMNI